MVTEYYEATGLRDDLNGDGLRQRLVTVARPASVTPVPWDEPIGEAIDEAGLIVGSVLSGNRNFEGRVHGKVKASYLASPPLVVAYAIAGNLDKDLTKEPIGYDYEDGTLTRFGHPRTTSRKP